MAYDEWIWHTQPEMHKATAQHNNAIHAPLPIESAMLSGNNIILQDINNLLWYGLEIDTMLDDLMGMHEELNSPHCTICTAITGRNHLCAPTFELKDHVHVTTNTLCEEFSSLMNTVHSHPLYALTPDSGPPTAIACCGQ